MNSWAPAAVAAAIDFRHRGVGPAVRDVVADRDGEQERVVGDEADVRAQALLREVAHVVPVDDARRRRSRRRSASADRATVDLPQPVRPTSATVSPRLSLSEKSSRTAAVRVRERDVAELDVAVGVDEVDGARPVLDVGLRVEDLVDPVGRRARALAQHQHEAEHPERRGEQDDVRP